MNYNNIKKTMTEKLLNDIKEDKGVITISDYDKVMNVVDSYISKLKKDNSLINKLNDLISITDTTKILIEKIDDLIITITDARSVNKLNVKMKEKKELKTCTNMVINQLKEYANKSGK